MLLKYDITKAVGKITQDHGLLCDDVHNVEILKVKQMFLKHLQKVILELNEPRTLQGLLEDYKTILHNLGFSTYSVKSAAIKTLIQKEFGDDVGFHLQYHRNQGTLVYDNGAGGSYIETTIYPWGVSDEQLLNTVARRLNDQLRNNPATIAELENDKE